MLDKDKDGKIGLGDIENFVSHYLSDMPSSGIVLVNQSFQPQSGSPQNMRVKTAGLNMSASFMSFEQNNIDIAQDVFDDYDLKEEGRIKRAELHLVIRDICIALGVKDQVDKEALESNLKYFKPKKPGYVDWEEFSKLYLDHFNF